MPPICIIDTSVFLNLINVPGKNQQKDEVAETFKIYVGLNATFILPMATIIETGNHIAQNGNGEQRRVVAQRFCEAVLGAFNGVTPWQPSEFPDKYEILKWINEFPDHAGRNKSVEKPNEGTSFGDLSIIKEYNNCLSKFSMSEVLIWSYDADLEAYRFNPQG